LFFSIFEEGGELVVKKVVFFCFAPFIKQHYKRFGAEILESNGFEVRFYDFSPIVFPDLHKNSNLMPQPVGENYFLFNEEKEAAQAIQNLGSECFVVIIGYYQAENFKIFQALSKTNIPYIFYAAVTFPGGLGGPAGSFWLNFLLKLNRINLRKLKALPYKPIFASLFGIRPPNICILGGENTLKNNGSAALIGKKTELIWTHSYDYDEYLDNLCEEEAEDNIAIFVDIGSPMFLWDHFLPNARTVTTVERYYPSVCRFLDYVEKELNLKVIIAAHPKSSHDDYPEYFGRRRTLRNQTLRLIKKSKLVIVHLSTALTYAVLEKKPCLFITTAEYERDISFSREIKMAGAPLEKTPINIDQEKYSVNWERELYVDEELYLNYKRQYIKKEGSEELNTWQVVANRLKDF
jgi:hypothetical protein